MDNTQKKRLMIVAENILICHHRKEENNKFNRQLDRFIQEFQPELRRLMDEFIEATGETKFISSRVRVYAEVDGKLTVKKPIFG
mgnify:CR=1 FL=1